MNHFPARLVLFLLTLLLIVPPLRAQEGALEPESTPDHGIIAASEGFEPDPFRVQAVVGGGSVDARGRNLGADCVGFISVAPDVRFQALTPFTTLRFIFLADSVLSDSALVVRDGEGRFWCNNDSFGVRNPTVTISDAPVGDYALWVGGFSPNTPVFGELYITSNPNAYPSSTGIVIPRAAVTPTAPTPTPIPPDALNPTRFPTHGTGDAAAGFLPDPYWRVVSGGGTVSAAGIKTEDTCAGFTTSTPDFRLNWSGQSTRLRFMFVPVEPQGANTSLIVRDPNGNWRCNLEFAPGFFDPLVEFINPLAGSYMVWVADQTAPNTEIIGVLYVTEKMTAPTNISLAETPALEALIGLEAPATTSAFTFTTTSADPYIIPGALGGGSVDIADLNPDSGCEGFFDPLPDFGFTLLGGTPYLRVFFTADDPAADATLIVLMPDGRWYCGDDSYRTRHPTINIVGSTTGGSVLIWVGSYSEGETISGAISLTRGDARPGAAD